MDAILGKKISSRLEMKDIKDLPSAKMYAGFSSNRE